MAGRQPCKGGEGGVEGPPLWWVNPYCQKVKKKIKGAFPNPNSKN